MNTILLSGGYDLERAEADIQSGLGDLVAFGRPFIKKGDFVKLLDDKNPERNKKTFCCTRRFVRER